MKKYSCSEKVLVNVLFIGKIAKTVGIENTRLNISREPKMAASELRDYLVSYENDMLFTLLINSRPFHSIMERESNFMINDDDNIAVLPVMLGG